MHKLLHIHHEIIFAWDSLKFVDERFENEIIFIGTVDSNKIAKLEELNIPYHIFENTSDSIDTIVKYAETFDGVIFYCLEDIKARILMNLSRKTATFARFFGFELYNLCMNRYLSDQTLSVLQEKQTASGTPTALFVKAKRKLKAIFNKEYSVNIDNQKKIYKKLDAFLVINRFEYNELKELFYLPKLIEMKFINHVNELNEFKVIKEKSNQIILGNNGAEVNNHIDVLEVIKNTSLKEKVQFTLFFSYGNKRAYSDKIRILASEMENVMLIENFLSKDEFTSIYESAAAIVMNSYRQNALGNIFTALKVGCKIYLNNRSSTYKWLVAEGFLISDVENLKSDLELGAIKLSVEEQQRNIDCFLGLMKTYNVNVFLNQVIDTLNEKMK